LCFFTANRAWLSLPDITKPNNLHFLFTDSQVFAFFLLSQSLRVSFLLDFFYPTHKGLQVLLGYEVNLQRYD
jgi:hypothetical protein